MASTEIPERDVISVDSASDIPVTAVDTPPPPATTSTQTPPDDAPEPPLKRPRTITWECPVCLDELGETRGLVPCLVVSCKPVPHSICLDCHARLVEAKRTQCPVCSVEMSVCVPVFDLIPKSDDEALRKASAAAASATASGELAATKANARLHLAETEARAADLMSQRVDALVGRVLSNVERVALVPVGTVQNRHCDRVPEWESERVSLSNRGSGLRRARLDHLNALARDMQPHLDDIFGGSSVSVTMWPVQEYNGKLVYMGYSMKRMR